MYLSVRRHFLICHPHFSCVAKNRKSDDFSQFSLVITEVHSELSISQNLRKIASLTIFCVTCDFSQFFVMLIINQTELRI